MGYPLEGDGMVQYFKAEVDSLKLLGRYLLLAIPTVLDSNEEIAIRWVRKGEKWSIPLLASEDALLIMLIHGHWRRKKGGWSNVLVPSGAGKFIKIKSPRRNPWPVPENLGVKPITSYKLFKSDKRKPIVEIVTSYIINQIKRHLKEIEQRFNEKFGYGQHVHKGFKLQSCGCHPDQLAISLIHMNDEEGT